MAEAVEFDVALCGARAGDKRQALRLVANGLAKIAGLPAETVLTALEARESLGSTGIGRGVALPHARIDGLPRCCRLVMRLTRSVNYDAIDDCPVDIIVGILLHPEEAAAPRLLSQICRLLRNPEAVAEARHSSSEEELRAALTPWAMKSHSNRLASRSY